MPQVGVRAAGKPTYGTGKQGDDMGDWNDDFDRGYHMGLNGDDSIFLTGSDAFMAGHKKGLRERERRQYEERERDEEREDRCRSEEEEREREEAREEREREAEEAREEREREAEEAREQALYRLQNPGDHKCPACLMISLKRNAKRCPVCRADVPMDYWHGVERAEEQQREEDRRRQRAVAELRAQKEREHQAWLASPERAAQLEREAARSQLGQLLWGVFGMVGGGAYCSCAQWDVLVGLVGAAIVGPLCAVRATRAAGGAVAGFSIGGLAAAMVGAGVFHVHDSVVALFLAGGCLVGAIAGHHAGGWSAGVA